MNTNIEQQLYDLFNRYIEGFHHYNMKTVLSCYHLPCTLHTPDKIAHLTNKNEFEQEFIDIFTVLKHANITKIVATKASYQQCQQHSIDVCIDWLFYTNTDEVFTDFTAFYHITCDHLNDNKPVNTIGKIVSVVSHEIQNSVMLANELSLN